MNFSPFFIADLQSTLLLAMKLKSHFFSVSVEKSFVHLSSLAMSVCICCLLALGSSSSVMIHFSSRDSAFNTF